jgi:hypothetical protein
MPLPSPVMAGHAGSRQSCRHSRTRLLPVSATATVSPLAATEYGQPRAVADGELPAVFAFLGEGVLACERRRLTCCDRGEVEPKQARIRRVRHDKRVLVPRQSVTNLLLVLDRYKRRQAMRSFT